MKKLLFVIHSLSYGGAERSLINLLNELPANRYQVDVLLFQNRGGFRQQIPAWVQLLETPEQLRRLYAPLQLFSGLSLRKLVGTCCAKLVKRTRKEQRSFRWKMFYKRAIDSLDGHYDVAVAYVGSEIMFYVRDKVSSDRKLVWVHNDYRAAGYSREDEFPYLADMDAIVSVSDECAEILRHEFPEFRERVHYVQNIISSSMVRAQAMQFEPMEFGDCTINILSVGRLAKQKGFDMAIQAAVLLRKQGICFRWFVIGEGELRSDLERQIRDAGAEEYFVLLGTRSNPYPYIRNCSVFVQPSRFEGKSVVLDEAKILGKAIVATAYPTVRDQIVDGNEGLIVPMSAEGVAEGVMRLLGDQFLYGRISSYLSTHEYGNQHEIEKYMSLFDGESNA
ncbi:MAG: glycosyltransferase [Clostridia bacterium]|nr:glycosyltransferase [Clostridia bacterium]